MSTVLISGAKGQLGSEIQAIADKFHGFHFIYTDVEELDITDVTDLEAKLNDWAPSYIVNCAAYTAVDKAESDRETAELINATAPKLLAEASQKRGIALVHVSTDYVFDGTSHVPYTEDLSPSPDSVYGHTKLEAEKSIRSICERSIIIRTSWLYSAYGHNFVKTMLKLGSERSDLNVIFDQVGTPTYAGDLAEVILTILTQLEAGSPAKPYGLYHFSNEGVCSWYDFAVEIFRMSGITCRVNPIETKEYPTAARRPHYSVLNKGKIKSTFGITIPHWTKSLATCLKVLAEGDH